MCDGSGPACLTRNNSRSPPVFAASETSASRMLRWMPGSVGSATVSLCLPADERSVPASRQGVGRGGRRTTRRKSSLRSQTYTGSMPLDSCILTITHAGVQRTARTGRSVAAVEQDKPGDHRVPGVGQPYRDVLRSILVHVLVHGKGAYRTYVLGSCLSQVPSTSLLGASGTADQIGLVIWHWATEISCAISIENRKHPSPPALVRRLPRRACCQADL